MSGGKIQLQEKDSDDEEENTAILKRNREDVNQFDHNLSHQIKFTENKHNSAIDINDNTSDDDAVDKSGSNGIDLQIQGEDGNETVAIPTISSELDGDVNLNNDSSLEEEHGVSRSTSEYLQMY